MKSETRRARMAELFGDDLKALLPTPEPIKTQEQINAENVVSREAEAVLALLRRTRFSTKTCKECKGKFTTDYACVGYCSDDCRKAALHKMGIDWDASRPLEERWGYPIPLIIPPSLRDHLQKCLDLIPEPEEPKPEMHPVPSEPQTQLNEVPVFEEELDSSILDVLLQ